MTQPDTDPAGDDDGDGPANVEPTAEELAAALMNWDPDEHAHDEDDTAESDDGDGGR